MDLVCHTIFYSASDRVSFLHFLRTVGQVGGVVQTYESLVSKRERVFFNDEFEQCRTYEPEYDVR